MWFAAEISLFFAEICENFAELSWAWPAQKILQLSLVDEKFNWAELDCSAHLIELTFFNYNVKKTIISEIVNSWNKHNHKMVYEGSIFNSNGQTPLIEGKFLKSGQVPAKPAQLSSSAERVELGPLSKTLSWAGSDLKTPELSWARQLSSANLQIWSDRIFS